MKKLLLLIFITTTFYAIGQKNIASTEEFKITGTIKKEKIVRLSDIAELPAQKIKSLVVTNHLGEKRGVIKKMRGVKILDILKDVEFDADNPKILSEYYLTFIASDGYKAVYSWNEIFNSPTGQNIFIVVEKDGVKLKDMAERIMIITPSDFKTGRRYIKALSQIVVNKTN